MKQLIASDTTASGTLVASTSIITLLPDVTGLAIQPIYVNATPSAVEVPSADINETTNVFTKVAHGLMTGLVGQIATDDTLPDGLLAVTNYFVIKVNADTFKLASSYANAVAGTAIDIIDAGVGNQTFTPTALSGVFKLQASNDGTNFSDIGGASINVTASGNTVINVTDPNYNVLKCVYTHTAGAVTLTTIINKKGEIA